MYIPLPNGLHYEWALKALKAGKHVLLEKPSCSNSVEAEKLFRSALLTQQGRNAGPGQLVLLEAFHSWFHPAVHKYHSLVDSGTVVEAFATLPIPKGIVGKEDIRFDFGLGGGCLMDAGTYCVRMLRQIFGDEPAECLDVQTRPPGHKGGDERVDESVAAKWRWRNGGVGTMEANMVTAGGYWLPWLTSSWPAVGIPMCRATHRETMVEDGTLPEGKEHVMSKTVTMWNFIMPSFWHRIDVVETHTLRDKSDKAKVVKTWQDTKTVKEYGEGERASWTTYRWQLEEFVNRVRGREVGAWVDGEDSIKQMRVLDGGYEKAGLPLRPTSGFVGEE